MLLPVKKVLCPTDFSEPSYQALEEAVELCSHFDAELRVIHVVPEIPRAWWIQGDGVARLANEPDLATYEEELHKSAQQRLDTLIKQRVPKELKSSGTVKRGDAASEIVRLAEDERASLIVMATHGLTGWRHITLGSVAERVVRASERPVLTIRVPRERR